MEKCKVCNSKVEDVPFCNNCGWEFVYFIGKPSDDEIKRLESQTKIYRKWYQNHVVDLSIELNYPSITQIQKLINIKLAIEVIPYNQLKQIYESWKILKTNIENYLQVLNKDEEILIKEIEKVSKAIYIFKIYINNIYYVKQLIELMEKNNISPSLRDKFKNIIEKDVTDFKIQSNDLENILKQKVNIQKEIQNNKIKTKPQIKPKLNQVVTTPKIKPSLPQKQQEPKPKVKKPSYDTSKVWIDPDTNLMWQKKCSSKKFFDTAGMNDYVKIVNSNHFGGFNDWKIPTIEELLTIVSVNKIRSGALLWKKESYFKQELHDNNIATVIASSTTQMDPIYERDYIQCINFNNGRREQQNGNFNLLLVRNHKS